MIQYDAHMFAGGSSDSLEADQKILWLFGCCFICDELGNISSVSSFQFPP